MDLRKERSDRFPVGGINPRPQDKERDCSVECAGIDIEKAERRRNGACDGGFSGSGGAVNGNRDYEKDSFLCRLLFVVQVRFSGTRFP